MEGREGGSGGKGEGHNGSSEAAELGVTSAGDQFMPIDLFFPLPPANPAARGEEGGGRRTGGKGGVREGGRFLSIVGYMGFMGEERLLGGK